MVINYGELTWGSPCESCVFYFRVAVVQALESFKNCVFGLRHCSVHPPKTGAHWSRSEAAIRCESEDLNPSRGPEAFTPEVATGLPKWLSHRTSMRPCGYEIACEPVGYVGQKFGARGLVGFLSESGGSRNHPRWDVGAVISDSRLHVRNSVLLLAGPLVCRFPEWVETTAHSMARSLGAGGGNDPYFGFWDMLAQLSTSSQ